MGGIGDPQSLIVPADRDLRPGQLCPQRRRSLQNIRGVLLLNVQAVELLRSYDLHASFGYTVHYAIADKSGYSVAVEYIGNKMYVTETRALTNFYVTPGPKYGVGSQKSVTRYENIMACYDENSEMTPAQLRDTMALAAQKNVADYNTQWTAIFDTRAKTVTYFHRGNFKNGWTVSL